MRYCTESLSRRGCEGVREGGAADPPDGGKTFTSGSRLASRGLRPTRAEQEQSQSRARAEHSPAPPHGSSQRCRGGCRRRQGAAAAWRAQQRARPAAAARWRAWGWAWAGERGSSPRWRGPRTGGAATWAASRARGRGPRAWRCACLAAPRRGRRSRPSGRGSSATRPPSAGPGSAPATRWSRRGTWSPPQLSGRNTWCRALLWSGAGTDCPWTTIGSRGCTPTKPLCAPSSSVHRKRGSHPRTTGFAKVDQSCW